MRSSKSTSDLCVKWCSGTLNYVKKHRRICRGVHCEGVLNPKMENGVAFYQQRTRKMVYLQNGQDALSGIRTSSVPAEFTKRDSEENVSVMITAI